MRAGEWERRVIVIEAGSCPISGAMACIAGCGEARSRVGRIRGSVVIRHMATGAKGRQRPAVTGAGSVALHAGHRQMEPSKRE